jgi:hypothetical protein
MRGGSSAISSGSDIFRSKRVIDFSKRRVNTGTTGANLSRGSSRIVQSKAHRSQSRSKLNVKRETLSIVSQHTTHTSKGAHLSRNGTNLDFDIESAV